MRTTTNNQDTLVFLSLPVGEEGRITPVLALIVNQSSAFTEVLLSDTIGSECIRTIYGGQIPAAYDPKPGGSLRAFMDKHDDMAHELLADGGLNYGSLSVARALLLMSQNPQLSPSQALAGAKAVAVECVNWSQRVDRRAREAQLQMAS